MIYENGTAYCQCVNGYTGSDCKTPPIQECKNGYWAYYEENPTCVCYSGWSGPDCNARN